MLVPIGGIGGNVASFLPIELSLSLPGNSLCVRRTLNLGCLAGIRYWTPRERSILCRKILSKMSGLYKVLRALRTDTTDKTMIEGYSTTYWTMKEQK